MQDYKIRRLPVISSEGELEGILSLNDLVLNAKMADEAVSDSIEYADVVKTYQAICKRELPATAVSAASA